MSFVGGTGDVILGTSGAEKYSEPGVSGPGGASSRIGGEPALDVPSVTGNITCSSVLDFDFVGDVADISTPGETVEDNGVVLVFGALLQNRTKSVVWLESRF